MPQSLRLIAGSACALALVTLLGCGGRNLYKNTKLIDPPLERGYGFMTRDYLLDAGAEPVDTAGTTVTEDTVFLTSERNGVQAFERHGFQKKWTFTMKNGVSSEPLLDGSVLYLGANDGNFYALDAEFGQPLWKYETKAPVYAKPLVSNQRVYLTASDDVVYCLDQATGKWIWHYKRGGNFITTIRGNAQPVVDGNFLYAGFSDGYLVALNANDGNIQWETRVHNGSKFTDVDASPLVDRDVLYVPSYDGSMYALNKKSGKVLWHVDYGGSRKVLLDEKSLYLGSSDGNVYSLNKESGKMNWKFILDRGTPTGLILHANYLVFGSSQQYFYAIHKGDGSLAYRYDGGLRGGFVANPVLSGKEVYAFSTYGNMYVFKTIDRERRK